MLEKIVKDINLCEGIDLNRSTINILAYADDIVLLGRNREIIIQLEKSLIKAAEEIKLKINEEKTKYMMVSLKNENPIRKEGIEVKEY